MYSIPKATDLLDALKNNYNEVIKSYENILTLNAYFNREIILGDIDSEVGEAIETLIRFYNQADDENSISIEDRLPIKIFIDSNGGDLNATLTIIDAIRMSKTPVWTINMGCAFSGGFFTFITGHKRFAYPHSAFLYHEGNVSNGGDANMFRNFASFYDKQLEMLKNIVLTHTNVSEELYESKKRDDWWITAQEALELGMCDEITEEFV